MKEQGLGDKVSNKVSGELILLLGIVLDIVLITTLLIHMWKIDTLRVDISETKKENLELQRKLLKEYEKQNTAFKG